VVAGQRHDQLFCLAGGGHLGEPAADRLDPRSPVQPQHPAQRGAGIIPPGATMVEEHAVPGLDVARFADWLTAHIPASRSGDLAAEVLAGGKSNLTYRIRRGGWQGVVRRPRWAMSWPPPTT
jgi:hypothetical protein